MANRELHFRCCQYGLDLWPELELVAPSTGLPRRLLILACSATKREGADLTALGRYDGPLWQTLRAADPDGTRATVAFLSARHGLGDARMPLAQYDAQLSAASAREMAEAGPLEAYPKLPTKRPKTMAGRQRQVSQLRRHQPLRVLLQLSREAGGAFDAVCLCGGQRYVSVIDAWLPEIQRAGAVAPGADIQRIAGPIGVMRQQLRGWLVADLATSQPAGLNDMVTCADATA